MGIPSYRFSDRHHEQFTCTVCLDVAEDPVAVTDCEHIFCKKCVDIEGLSKCPSCQQQLKKPKWADLKGGFKRVYLDLKVKCLNSSCDHELDISNFLEHDLVCPITFEFCKECGLQSRRGAENDHSCIQVIKDDYEGKLEQLKVQMEQKIEEKMAIMKEQLKEELTQNMGPTVEEVMKLKNEMEQKMEQKENETEEKLKKERQRYEDFIAIAVTTRNGFNNDWNISLMRCRFRSVYQKP